MRRGAVLTAAVMAAVVFFALLTLPPSPRRLPLGMADAALAQRTVRGAFHIHTTRSDGAEDKAAIAAAAARAGLQFAIFSDHGDATRPADPPAYLHGVLCLDGVEISTNGGHYVALGISAAPYPLGGEAAAVVEDVRRLGGFGVAAHPDHTVRELAWTGGPARADGLEWLNLDAEWRTERSTALARTLIGYFMRPAPAIAALLDRPAATLDRWDAESDRRRIVALAAADAHGGARAGRDRDEPGVPFGPSYEASFGVVSNRVLLQAPFSGAPVADAEALVAAIRRGAVYSVIDAISPDVLVDFGADGPRVTSDTLPGTIATIKTPGGARRIEITTTGAPGTPPVPWVVTNFAYPSGQPAEDLPAALAPTTSPGLAVGSWRVEHEPTSTGAVSERPGGFDVAFQLGAGDRRSQFVAAAADLAPNPAYDTLTFLGRASRPMRVSVQLRFPSSERRWVSSVYLDPTERTLIVPVASMHPAERDGGPMPPPQTARSILFVVDLINARPGEAGEFSISDIRAGRR